MFTRFDFDPVWCELNEQVYCEPRLERLDERGERVRAPPRGKVHKNAEWHDVCNAWQDGQHHIHDSNIHHSRSRRMSGVWQHCQVSFALLLCVNPPSCSQPASPCGATIHCFAFVCTHANFE